MTLTKNDSPSVVKHGWNFDNSYARLPEVFFELVDPTPVRDPKVAVLNQRLASSLGLNLSPTDETVAAIVGGNAIPEGSIPIAQAYAGHQYGHFTMLGDGRAILLGEHLSPSGARVDIQLKGPGRTPFSRRGDGRAALGPMLREYIISEAMHALGIPTTRSLAVVTTGEMVRREIPLPGAVLVRVAQSHIRVGTFEYASALEDRDALQALLDYTIARHYPNLVGIENPALGLLNEMVDRQASLVAKWLMIGFIHGVMNTDNMSVSGETIDYGPCAFLDAYHPATVFSSIDRHGRYAYANQPTIALWNVERFAETLLPVINADPDKALELARTAVDRFQVVFRENWMAGMRAKLGLFKAEADDGALFESLLTLLMTQKADYTNTFRAITNESFEGGAFLEAVEFLDWRKRWQSRRANQEQTRAQSQALMTANNPARIPRNHLVEAALTAASTQGDYSLMVQLLASLARPYEDISGFEGLRSPAPAGDVPYRTFCGT